MAASGAERVVVDVETTGLGPGRRIVEIAMVVITAGGDVLDRFESLVAAPGSIGASRVHGLTRSELLSSPNFGHLASEVLRRLEGRVLVAHNLRFDWSTLAAEFGLLGVRLSDPGGICTATLAARCMNAGVGPSMVSLRDAAAHFDVAHHSPHTAAGDAEATRLLLEALRADSPLPSCRPMPRVANAWRLPAPRQAVTRQTKVDR